jgi:hypothetical protein
VLETTLKAPDGWLPAPGSVTTSKVTDETASTGRNRTHFPPGTGVAAGDPMGSFDLVCFRRFELDYWKGLRD